MQVSNTLNNSIRILFNPKVEAFKLFDFLIVKSGEDRYIAEIIEIYDDKFDASQDVAKLKIFYKLTTDNEVVPYDNFTPSKECEIVKIKQDDIEKFINQGKDTFIFATNAKNSYALNIQYDFFNNNAIILADKIESANGISTMLARKLAMKKKAVIVDSTGVIDFEGAKKLKASENFKLPLNYTTIDFVFDKCLSDASLEFQAIGGQILNQIKEYAKKQELGFIPFNAFAKVLMEQYKVTPFPELKLLLSRMKRYQLNEIFASNKKDYENLLKTVEENLLTIVDLSGIEVSWQKVYLEHIIEDIKEEAYLITRINDENCDVDLINKIYSQKKNITFIPTVSYNYKKLPSIMQYCKNYILLPSLYQRNDFLNANFALANLIDDECIIFGENTDNFLYLARDYEIKTQEEKRKTYRKIALSLVEDEEEILKQQLDQKGDYFENIKKEAAKKTDSEKLMEELTRFEQEKAPASEVQQEAEPVVSNEVEHIEIQDEPVSQTEQEQEEVSQIQEVENHTDLIEEVEESEDDEAAEESFEQLFAQASDETKEKITEDVETIENKIELSDDQEENIENDSVILEEMEETPELEIKSSKDNFGDAQEETQQEIQEEFKPKSDPQIGKVNITNADLIDAETIDLDELAKNGKTDFEKAQEAKEKERARAQENASADDLGDDELDFIELSKATNGEENIDLDEIADVSMNENFEQIVDSKPKEGTAQTIAIDKDIKISSDILEQPATNSSLPIFKEENSEDKTPEFKEGDIVIHPQHGRGRVIKTFMHEQRQLVHVDFEKVGKKLLEPQKAKITLEQ